MGFESSRKNPDLENSSMYTDFLLMHQNSYNTNIIIKISLLNSPKGVSGYLSWKHVCHGSDVPCLKIQRVRLQNRFQPMKINKNHQIIQFLNYLLCVFRLIAVNYCFLRFIAKRIIFFFVPFKIKHSRTILSRLSTQNWFNC